MGTSILITSGKGGTGKTACAAAIGSFLARMGHRTLCVDCDAALRNLDLTLGMAEGVLWDYGDVLEGRVSASEAPAEHPKLPGLYLLSAPVDKLPAADSGAFRALIDGYRESFDYILLDSPAGIGSGFRLAASVADMAVIVATGDLTSLRDGQRAAAELRAMGCTELRLLINRVSPREYKKLRRSLDDVIDSVGAQLIGVVSEDSSVSEAGNLQIPLISYGAKRAWGQFKNIAGRIAGEKIKLARI